MDLKYQSALTEKNLTVKDLPQHLKLRVANFNKAIKNATELTPEQIQEDELLVAYINKFVEDKKAAEEKNTPPAASQEEPVTTTPEAGTPPASPQAPPAEKTEAEKKAEAKAEKQKAKEQAAKENEAQAAAKAAAVEQELNGMAWPHLEAIQKAGGNDSLTSAIKNKIGYFRMTRTKYINKPTKRLLASLEKTSATIAEMVDKMIKDNAEQEKVRAEKEAKAKAEKAAKPLITPQEPLGAPAAGAAPQAGNPPAPQGVPPTPPAGQAPAPQAPTAAPATQPQPQAKPQAPAQPQPQPQAPVVKTPEQQAQEILAAAREDNIGKRISYREVKSILGNGIGMSAKIGNITLDNIWPTNDYRIKIVS